MDALKGIRLYHLDRSLAERRALRLNAARGARVVSLAGDVWITEDGRLDDVLLAAGESAVLERDGMALITPFGSADVEILLPAAAEANGFARSAIGADSIEHHEHNARRLQAYAIAAAVSAGVEWLRARLRPAHRPAGCA